MVKLAQVVIASATLLWAHGACSASYDQVYAFDGGSDAVAPTSALLQIGTQFIGATCAGGAYKFGALYTVTPGGKEQVIYSFGAQGDGVCPSSALIKVGNKLYGVTEGGGAYGYGTVFVIKVLAGEIGAPSIIHSFSNMGTDGLFPTGGLTLFNGTIYGTTFYGGTSKNCNYGGCGTVFFITPHDRVGALYSFQGGNDGAVPSTTLLPVGNLLFGTTLAGGTGGPCDQEGAIILGCGTVFSITPRGEEKPIYAFQGRPTDGEVPNTTLVTDGVELYGTTQYGGGVGYCLDGNSNRGCGTVFAVNTTGAERVVHMFGKDDGAWPEAGLTLLNGVLYGSTYAGYVDSEEGDATLFSLTPVGRLTILHKFSFGSPFAPLTASGDYLWGTTVGGGSTTNCPSGCGTVFKLGPVSK